MDDTRQQRRKREREQVKVGRSLIAGGLPAQPRRGQVVVVARVLSQKLSERANASRASEAAAIVHDLVEGSLAAFPPKVSIACKAGCNYCCHAYTSVVAPEVFRIANAVRASREPALKVASVQSRCAPLKGLAIEARVGRKLPCPLLVGGQCSVYRVRPMVCRQATSLSLPACIEEFEGLDLEGRVEVSSAHLAHASNANIALLGALKASQLPMNSFELSAALDIALADPECEQRWLQGDDVFAGLPRNLGRPASFEAVAAQIAQDLAD